MGYWDPKEDKPVRIDRQTERVYFGRFVNREPGFYDDSEWWKLVEQADRRPLQDLVVCPACGAQNLQERELCDVCKAVLIARPCVNPACAENLPRSATHCDACGTSQLPEVKKSWTCMVCHSPNGPSAERCGQCGEKKGTPNALSEEALFGVSNRSDGLSLSGLTVPLSDGSHSQPIDVEVYVTRGPLQHPLKNKRVCAVVVKGDSIRLFLDLAHPLFASYRTRPEDVVAFETALYVYDANRRLLGGDGHALHSLTYLAWNVLQSWRERLEASDERLREEASGFWRQLREQLREIVADAGDDFYGELSAAEQSALASAIVGAGHDLSKFPELRKTGKYLAYLPVGAVVRLFERIPEAFFDGRFWSTAYVTLPDLPDAFLQEERRRLRTLFGSALRDAADLIANVSPDPLLRERARSSLALLRSRQV
jgi:hypothetical protein